MRCFERELKPTITSVSTPATIQGSWLELSNALQRGQTKSVITTRRSRNCNTWNGCMLCANGSPSSACDDFPHHKPHHMHQTTAEGDRQKLHVLPPLCIRIWHQWKDEVDRSPSGNWYCFQVLKHTEMASCTSEEPYTSWEPWHGVWDPVQRLLTYVSGKCKEPYRREWRRIIQLWEHTTRPMQL